MKELVKDITIALVFVGITLMFVRNTQVVGISMSPSFEERDYLLVSRQSYNHAEPARGDVIVFKSELVDSNGKRENLIKRVIGLPGDTVEVKNDKVYINGKLQSDSYTKERKTNGEVEVIVPEGYYFCLGDNRLHSVDSRYSAVGLISEDQIVGKVIFRIYPFSKFGRIPQVMSSN